MMDHLSLLLAVSELAVWSFLLVQAFTSARLSRYPFFYAYVVCSLVTTAAVLSVPYWLGADHPAYAGVLLYFGFPLIAARLVLLIRVLRVVPDCPIPSFLIPYTLAITLYVTWKTLFGVSADWMPRIMNVVCAWQACIAGLALTKAVTSRRISLGRNSGSILLALVIVSTMSWIHWTGIVYGGRGWPSTTLLGVGQIVEAASWLVIVWGLWKFDPPKPLIAPPRTSLGRFSEAPQSNAAGQRG